MACGTSRCGGARGAVVERIHVVQGTHDLDRTPSLVDAQVCDEVRCLEATVSTCAGRDKTGLSSASSVERTGEDCAAGTGGKLIDDLRHAALFSRDRGREA